MTAHRIARLTLLGACLIIFRGEARAQQMPPITIIDGMSQLSNVGDLIKAKINNDLAAAMSEKNLAKFQKHLSELRREMPKFREALTRTSDEAKKVIAVMEKQDQSKWSQSQREEYQQAQEALTRCNQLETTYRKVTADLKAISNKSVILHSDAKTFAANPYWFKGWLDKIQGEVSTLGAGVAGVSPGGQATGTGTGPGMAAEGGPMLKVESQTTDVWFLVNGTWLKPKDQPIMVRGDRLVIRALAVTKTRDFITTKKPTGNTTIVEQGPYAFRFTVSVPGGGTGETSWQSKNEKYEWNIYGPTRFPPSHAVSTTKRANDTVTWQAPPVRKVLGDANQTYTFGVHGDLAWDYQRSGDMGNVKRTDFESFHGTLAVTVLAR